ncbi:MAG: UDP-N-acetylmuramoyl-tripeptide--D-alanyl-D-alanine ligase [Cystobacterineae bacterium]|nr:UDP-N-acetylmuramoyl-tripeptide--D-alanyl-D-alanine ligase [Cystobacterineae bacterium]
MACFSLAEVVLAAQATPLPLRNKAPSPSALQEVSFSSVSTDTRTLAPGALFVALQGEKYDGQAFVAQAAQKGAGGALVLKGFSPQVLLPESFILLEVNDTLKALGQLAHFHRKRTPLPLGAVTGSSGKTTTKELVASILRQRGEALATQGNLNNEIGLPLTLLGLSSTHWAGVVEMGMSNPGEISRLAAMAMPDAGLISAIHAAHLYGLGSIEAVAKAKGELFEALPSTATALVCMDEPRIVAQAQRCVAKQLLYGKSPGADLRLMEIFSLGAEGQRLRWEWQGQGVEAHLRLLGEHNALNATAALAMGLVLGCNLAHCVRGLEAAKAVPRRLSLRAGPLGTRILDDCYNANPASMQAALHTAAQLASPQRPLLALGDMLELGESEAEAHAQVGQWAAQHARGVIFIGKRMHLAWEKAHAYMGEAALWFEDAPEALEPLRLWLRPGDVVLVKASRGMRLERIADALCINEGDEACFMPSIPS